MAHIQNNGSVMMRIKCEDLIAVIQDAIHKELQKPETDIDAGFIEECVNAVLEIEQDSDNAFVPLVPLMKRQEFVEHITGERRNFKALGKFARTAVIAAALAASTVTANAAVEVVTGVNLLEEAGNKVQNTLENWGVIKHKGIDVVDGEDDGDDVTVTSAEESTTLPAEESTAQEPTTETTTTAIAARTTTTHHIEVVDGEDEENEPASSKSQTTKPSQTKPSEKETTTKTPPPPTTAESVTKPDISDSDGVTFVGVEAYFDGFKTDYIYGEELSYDGLTLMEVFSDGTKKELPLEKCSYTKSVDMSKTADYTLRIIYKASVVEIKITVRPDEDTRGAEVCKNELYEYYLTERGAYITAYSGDEEEINLDEVDSNRVIVIGEGVFKGTNTVHFTARYAEKIFPNAFRDCEKLVYADIPNAVYIGANAFENCTNLKTPVFSSELNYLGTAVFKNTGIEQITIPQNITAIPSALFEDCAELKSVTLLGRVTDIGASAFSECAALEKISGSQFIKNVSNLAFYNDTLLCFDEEPTALESAGDYAFAYCNNINITHIGKELKVLGIGSFMYCHQLCDVELDGSIKTIPSSAFRGAHIERLVLSKGIKQIGDYAFMSTMLKMLELPDTVTQIGAYSFYITFLRDVYFPDRRVRINTKAFYENSRLTFYVYDNTSPCLYAQEHSIKYELLTPKGGIDVSDGEDD